jgi:hypothetical protein
MPTPRPLGVRRANVNEERFVRAANNLPARRPLYPCGAWGSARCSARLTHIALGPVGLGLRRRQGPLCAIMIPRIYLLGLARASGRRASTLKGDKNANALPLY